MILSRPIRSSLSQTTHTQTQTSPQIYSKTSVISHCWHITTDAEMKKTHVSPLLSVVSQATNACIYLLTM